MPRAPVDFCVSDATSARISKKRLAELAAARQVRMKQRQGPRKGNLKAAGVRAKAQAKADLKKRFATVQQEPYFLNSAPEMLRGATAYPRYGDSVKCLRKGEVGRVVDIRVLPPSHKLQICVKPETTPSNPQPAVIWIRPRYVQLLDRAVGHG